MTTQKSERNPLFRAEAMERLGSPDELDRLMHVTRPRGWLALIALVILVLAATAWGIFGTIPIEVSAEQGVLLHSGARHEVVSQVDGLVVEVMVQQEDIVKAGQSVARIRLAGGQTVNVQTLFSGSVDEVTIATGMVVSAGQEVAIVEKGDEPLQAVLLVPIDAGKQLQTGMLVHVSPATANSDEYGFIRGKVASVSQFPITRAQAEQLLLNESLVDTLFTKQNQLEVDVELTPDPATKSGFSWSSSGGPPFAITHGTVCTATFVLSEERPINLILPSATMVR